MKTTSKFHSIAAAILAMRNREVVPHRDSMTDELSLIQPDLFSDKELVREIMKLGVDLYKIEKNIQD